VKITKLSLAAIAAVAFTTAQADTISDIKVDGQTKLWYETWDKGQNNANELFDRRSASGDAVLKLGATAKVGPLKVGVVNYSVSTLGLEQSMVASTRTARPNTDVENWTGEAYVEGTIGKTTAKVGRQSLNTPFAFTENWNAVPNNFEAIKVTTTAVPNVTLGATAISKGNSAGNFKVADGGEFTKVNASVVSAKTKLGMIPVNAYYYDMNDNANFANGSNMNAYWIDATAPIGPAKLTGIYAGAHANDNDDEEITSLAVKATGKVGTVNLLAAYSTVDENKKSNLAIANIGTGWKKTQLPTAGVYTDGLFVAQPGSNAFKLKAATKLAGFGVAAQVINNTNDQTASKETTEFDLIVSKKFGPASVKAIFLNRAFEDDATDKAAGGNHVRVIAAYNF